MRLFLAQNMAIWSCCYAFFVLYKPLQYNKAENFFFFWLQRYFVKTVCRKTSKTDINPNWHEGGHFPTLVSFGSDFVNWFLIKHFQTFLRWKFSSITLIWHLAKLIQSYKRMLLGGTKDEDFSCFHSSWQLRLRP